MRHAVAAAILAILLAGPVWGAPLRDAHKGDRIASLVVGLNRVDLDSGACGTIPVQVVGYVVPGREKGMDNASFIGVIAGGRIVLLASYDEDDLSVPVKIYADTKGDGFITDVWPAADAPNPCQIILQSQAPSS